MMLPKWHVLLGIVFTLLIWIIFPGMYWGYLLLVFLASVFIDLDHYMLAVDKTKSLSLKKAFIYFKILRIKGLEDKKRGIRGKRHFMIFHTLEFHIIVLLLGFLWEGFFFIFLGMLFHSIVDIIQMTYDNEMNEREFFFVNWIAKRF